jgi:anti-sigma factor RsiW
MNTCPIETEWVLYAAGELDAARQGELRAHLASCRPCARQAAQLARGLRALETIDRDVLMRPAAMDALRRRLRAAPARRPMILTILWQRRRFTAVAAGFIVAAVLTYALWPVHVDPIPVARHYTTDTVIQDRLTEISATIELMEYADGPKVPAAPAAAPSIDDMDLEQYLEYLDFQIDT